MLRDVLMEEPSSARERHAQDRMRDMHELIELLVGWADDVRRLDDQSLTQLLTLGAGVSKLLHLKSTAGGFIAPKRPASERKD